MRLVRYVITLIKKIVKFIIGEEPPKKSDPVISILIPYKYDGKRRHTTFKWILRYLRASFSKDEAEIIVGRSKGKIFCKTEAFNDAARRARGKVFVLYDADAYINTQVIKKCTTRILNNMDDHLWFVPYRHLYRLTREASDRVLESDPAEPYQFPSPPDRDDVEEWDKSMYGHRYGAMMMIFPREAYETLGCFDERFKGWGGEDVAILHALDTLYGKHKTTKNDLLHLWHPKTGKTYQTRVWKGQTKQQNNRLSMRYHKARRHPKQMRALVDEGCRYRQLPYGQRKKWDRIQSGELPKKEKK